MSKHSPVKPQATVTFGAPVKTPVLPVKNPAAIIPKQTKPTKLGG